MKIEKILGKGIPLEGNDIDTDRIIPARFMKCVTFDELGKYVFYDERFDEKGQPKRHPFNNSKFSGGSILIVGKNFGCGSSREHAPQALTKYGIKAIIGESFAEIFAGNCTMLGIPAISMKEESLRRIKNIIEKDPETELAINLESRKVYYQDTFEDSSIPEFARLALIEGKWDTTSVLLESKQEIEKTYKRIPYLTY